MIHFLEKHQIDEAKWNQCIAKSKNAHIFSFSWYLNICSQNWGGLVLGDYDAVFPLAWKSKFGLRYLYQPYFTRYFGIHAKQSISDEERNLMINAIPSDFKYWDFCLFDNDLKISKENFVKPKKFQTLPLNTDYKNLYLNYSENLIRNLRKAEKASLTILSDYNPELIAEQFRILKNTKNLEFGDHEIVMLKQLMKVVSQYSKISCWASTTPSGEIMSGAFFMEINNTIVYLKGFSSDKGKKNGAMHFLFDRFIHSQINQNKILDFGGSNIETIARFFKSFGASDSIYLHLQFNRLPLIIKWAKK